VGRDDKAVRGDVSALIKAGVVDRQDRGVVFPYEGVHVDFVLGKAA
jgi:predicted transcriptional regulator